MHKHKAIIIGAGIFGLSCAYHLAKAGIEVTVYDAAALGEGASGGIIGALLPHTPDEWNAKKQFQYESLRDGAAFWTKVDTISGKNSGYGRIGRIVPITTKRELQLAQNRVQSAPEYWEDAFDYTLSPTPSYLAKNIAPFGVIHETLSARLFPSHALDSLARACENLGVTFYLHHRIDAIDAHSISGAWGKAQADYIILAAGVGGFELLEQLINTKSGQGVKGQAALLQLSQTPKIPQIHADGIYIVPHSGGQIALGSTSEKIWQEAYKTDTQLDDLITQARKILPALRDATIIKRWARLRPKARKADPIIGQITGVYVALGGFKIGIGIAPKVGQTMRDLILGRQVNLPKTFTPSHHL